MTRQTWTAAVSAFLFMVAAAVVAMTPIPFVTYAPGATHALLAGADGRPVISVDGLATHTSSGNMLVATVAVTRPDAPVSLPEALYAHWAPDREVLPREVVQPTRTTTADLRTRDAQALAATQAEAAAAALRAAGVEVRQIPMVQSVASAGPAAGKLVAGDFILKVDDVPTPDIAAVRAQIEKRGIGASVTFEVLRDRRAVAVTVDTAASKTQASVPVWGGNLVMGYSYSPRITYAIEPIPDGASAGLMLALAVFDRITPGPLVDGRVIAGAGTIDGSGDVGQVTGVREKLSAAEASGASVFLLPADNCADLVDVRPTVRLVSVATLEEAITSLELLADPATEQRVKGCT